MRSQYDVVVIGAGPAGSMAAYEIASEGHSVLLLEKHKKPGTPHCCAEAVSRLSFEKLIEPRKEWISSSIEKIRLVGPRGRELLIHHPRAGFILDRKKLDYDLANRAVEAGCRLECETIGLELLRHGNLFKYLEVLKQTGDRIRIEASIFIAADGVESKIARLAGMQNLINLDEIESLLQYKLENISVDPETAEFHVGNEIAPKGYLWVFPKSESSANVGLGITVDSNRSDQLESRLNRFIEQRFSGGNIAERVCGLAPKYQGKKMFRMANLLIAGDAARAIDSLSGAGIINAIMSGKYAGMAAAEYISGNIKDIEQIEKLYPGKFLAAKGDELSLYTKLREVYKALDDDDFTDIIEALSKYFGNNSTYGINAGKLLSRLVRTRPRLLRLVRYLV